MTVIGNSTPMKNSIWLLPLIRLASHIAIVTRDELIVCVVVHNTV